MIKLCSCHLSDSAVRKPSERTAFYNHKNRVAFHRERIVVITRSRSHRFVASAHLRSSRSQRSNGKYRFWPWRARPVPFWGNGLRFDPLTSDSVFTQCVPWRRFASCHTTTRCRISSRRGMPKTRLLRVTKSLVCSPVFILKIGSCFMGVRNGSSKGASENEKGASKLCLWEQQTDRNHQYADLQEPRAGRSRDSQYTPSPNWYS